MDKQELEKRFAQSLGGQEPRAGKLKSEEIPPGCGACYVALPDMVSNGKGDNAKPGERIIGPNKTIDNLELRGLAFRDENEAKAAFTSHKRKVEAEIAARLEAERKRAENRRRWRDEAATKALEGVEWTN
jgi:hypothetical protein